MIGIEQSGKKALQSNAMQICAQRGILDVIMMETKRFN